MPGVAGEVHQTHTPHAVTVAEVAPPSPGAKAFPHLAFGSGLYYCLGRPLDVAQPGNDVAKAEGDRGFELRVGT
jgi:hypothetical protein